MVREARPENMVEINELIQKNFDATSSEEIPKGIRALFQKQFEESRLWYYFLEDKIVGIIGVNGKNNISLTFVDAAYRNKGVAKELFEALKAILMAQGQFTITTTPIEGSRGFFEKLGFKQVKKGTTTLAYTL